MATTITYHKSGATTSQKGVAPAPKALPSSFPGIDPLSSAGEQVNKPGSSIPTIFARMLFFHTSFKNVDTQTVGGVKGTAPVYNQLVSQCLDLLERIFNHDSRLSFVEWDSNNQIPALRASKHDEIADALKSHFDKYLRDYGVKSIYLILEDGNTEGVKNVIGGTSPFTFVFTSPNANATSNYKPLVERDPKFKEYIYRLYAALHNDVPAATAMYEAIEGFMSYVTETLKIESDKTLVAKGRDLNYNTILLENDFPGIELGSVKMPIASYNLGLARPHPSGGTYSYATVLLSGRKQGALESHFFIKSKYLPTPFDSVNTPIVLADGQYHNLKYYDKVDWDDTIKVPQMENVVEALRPLPGAPAIRHLYFTTIDFLDTKLVKLPYAIDEDNFYHAINVNENGYLLPLKPRVLQYFDREDIDRMLEIEETKDHTGAVSRLTVKLKVPVQNNQGSFTGNILLSRDYDLKKDVLDLKAMPISVGITPFLRNNGDEDENHYSVLYQFSRSLNESFGETGLKFYDFGKKGALDVDKPKSRNNSTNSDIYKLRTAFDAFRIDFSGGGNDGETSCGGLVIPKFKQISHTGGTSFYYSIDFGTTNTHIAFAVNGVGDPESFGPDNIRKQAVYLAAIPKEVKNAIKDQNTLIAHNEMEHIYGFQGKNLKMAQERQFFPNFISDEYGFPIRTVTGEIIRPEESDLYSGASIGFRFSKELIQPSEVEIKYYTKVKWDLESGNSDAKVRALLFFEEILEMIRTHWLLQTGASLKNPPVIVLTYPLAMQKITMIVRLWATAYSRVFKIDPNEALKKIERVPESLAPAYSLIYKGMLPALGLLNVDIGGATTDIQYYREDGAKKHAFYNSVRFAGDDLWGTGYENVPGSPGEGIKDNIFIRFAKENLKDTSLLIDKEQITIDKIEKSGKEYINMLLRDSDNNFINKLSEDNMSPVRKVIFLHYAALMYHIVNLLAKKHEDTAGKFPATVNFTGFGSKYIETLFGSDHPEKLRKYTIALLKAFGVPAQAIPDDFKINFEEHPKDVTAEGAALYARQQATKKDNRILSDNAYHYGFDMDDAMIGNFRYRDLESIKNKVETAFDKYIDAFQSVKIEGLNVPQLTEREIKKLKTSASSSYDTMRSNTADKDDKEGMNQIKDSVFFWLLKGSLFNFDID